MKKGEHLLICLAEECAEVAQAATKDLRFGLADRYPNENSMDNRERLQLELCDLVAVVELLVEADIIDPFHEERQQAVNDKKAKVAYFLDYSKERGTLDDTVTQKEASK